MEIGFTVDWLSITFPVANAKAFGHTVGFMSWASDVKGVPPRGYTHARELETGLRVAWNESRDDMGVHFQFSGSTLRWYATKSLTWYEVMVLAKQKGGRTSRVDLAVDVHDGGLKLSDFTRDRLRPYEGKGRTPKLVPMGTPEDGWTVYVGSRTSEKFLRVYDKAKETGDFSADYVRIELECKGEIAHALGWEFPNMPKERCVDMARTLIRGQANFNHPSWDFALSSDEVELTVPQGRERDTLGWLINVCAPALAKEIAKRPHSPVLDEFWNALRMKLREQGIEVD